MNYQPNYNGNLDPDRYSFEELRKAVPQYQIGMIGLGNSGKSIYVASLHNLLYESIRPGGFKATVPHDQGIELTTRVNDLRFNKSWTNSTYAGELLEYNFTLQTSVMTKQGPVAVPVYNIDYLDYQGENFGRDRRLGMASGEVFTDQQRQVTNKMREQIVERLQQADGMLVLLDGVVLYHALEKKTHPNPRAYILEEMLSYLLVNLSRLQQTGGVHFLVTKWDVLHNAGIGLQNVCELLLEQPEFKRYVSNQQYFGTTIRLIPVSSVGNKFATYDPDTGDMNVNETSIFAPYGLETSMACIIHDHWQARLAQLKQAEEARIRQNGDVPVVPQVNLLETVFEQLGMNASRLVDSLELPEFLRGMAESAQQGAITKRERAEKETASTNARLSHERAISRLKIEAVDKVAQEMDNIRQELEASETRSLLAKPQIG